MSLPTILKAEETDSQGNGPPPGWGPGAVVRYNAKAASSMMGWEREVVEIGWYERWGWVIGFDHAWDRVDADHLDLVKPSDRETLPGPEPEANPWNAKCPRCGADAYQGLTEVECSRKCSHETTPRAHAT